MRTAEEREEVPEVAGDPVLSVLLAERPGPALRGRAPPAGCKQVRLVPSGREPDEYADDLAPGQRDHLWLESVLEDALCFLTVRSESV